jgi:hypothetical protein
MIEAFLIFIVNFFYHHEIRLAKIFLRKFKYFEDRNLIFLIIFSIVAFVVLVANIAIFGSIFVAIGMDTEFVGFGFVLMGIVGVSILILSAHLVKEVWLVVRAWLSEGK